jgi:sodium/hydrogen antiporter
VAAVGVFVTPVLFVVLFTDGMQDDPGRLRTAWRLPGRALLFGFPLTLVLIAAGARTVLGLPWVDAFVVAAALAPTDPVLVRAIVGGEASRSGSSIC